MFQCFETNLKHLVIYFIYRLVATILLYNLYVSMFQCFTETKCMPWDFCGGFVKALIYVAKTKALISFAVTAKLICVFVFAYTKSRFSHNEAH